MPTSTRLQAHTRSQDQQESTPEIAVQEMQSQNARENEVVDQEMDEDDEMIDEDDEGFEADLEPFPPPGLKEISSLASWTVSTAKPGNGVVALRSPDTSLFWQSDGPQPHLLSIHFFKLVSIVYMRVYLDFDADESYTPTKIQFLAGMGVHDLQEFAEMSFEQPTGWIEVDFSGVGPTEPIDDVPEPGSGMDWSKRPVLRAFLVQVKILENHQNGKDTHLRAVQLFARDESQEVIRAKGASQDAASSVPMRTIAKKKGREKEMNNIKLAPWMLEPEIR